MKELVFSALLGLGGGGVYAMLGTGMSPPTRVGRHQLRPRGLRDVRRLRLRPAAHQRHFALPWVDILPTHGLNLPVHITVQEGGTSEGRRSSSGC